MSMVLTNEWEEAIEEIQFYEHQAEIEQTAELYKYVQEE